jgi:HD-GYP domain-containing protein (c-di-GMP phosphodiesterase class II)
MQSRRVYDAGKDEEFIINELKKGSGTQFDPNLVPYMIQLIEDGFAPLPQSDE